MWILAEDMEGGAGDEEGGEDEDDGPTGMQVGGL